MLDEKDLQAIAQLMDVKLQPVIGRLDGIDGRLDGIDGRLDGIDGRLDGIDTRLDKIENRLESVEESQEETRSGVNSLLEWADKCGYVIKFPLPTI